MPTSAHLPVLFLLLVVFGFRHQVSGTLTPSTCKSGILQSAFKVRVDLDGNNNATQPTVCSDAEKSGLGELIEKGIQKASHKVVEQSKSLSLDESNASVCKIPKEEESRRLSSRKHSVRKLKKRRRHRFRYYGGMRCRLCSEDNTDTSTPPIISLNPIQGTQRCSPSSWRTSPHTLKVPIPGKQGPKKVVVLDMTFSFVLHELGGFQGQHMFVTINNKTVDLGEFYEGKNEGKRAQKIDGLAWNMKPELTTTTTNNPIEQRHNVTIHVPMVFFRDKEYLDVELTFGDDKDNNDGEQQRLTAEFGAKVCYIDYGHNSMGNRRRLISSPVSSPTTSYSSPMASPVSVPAIAKSLKIKKENKIMFGDYPDVGTADASAIGMIPSFGSNPHVNLKPPEIISESNNLVFQKLVRDTLISVLNTDLKVAVSSKPDHCMYGEEIKAVVHLTPKPEWEKNLPTCSN